jgi:hypothetical protein
LNVLADETVVTEEAAVPGDLGGGGLTRREICELAFSCDLRLHEFAFS